jgi:hypothetical protein
MITSDQGRQFSNQKTFVKDRETCMSLNGTQEGHDLDVSQLDM